MGQNTNNSVLSLFWGASTIMSDHHFLRVAPVCLKPGKSAEAGIAIVPDCFAYGLIREFRRVTS